SQVLDNFYEVNLSLVSSGEKQTEIPVALYNDGKLIAKTTANLDSDEQLLRFTIPKDDFHGYAEITDNSLEYDNRLYFSISKPEQSNVISIGEQAKNTF